MIINTSKNRQTIILFFCKKSKHNFLPIMSVLKIPYAISRTTCNKVIPIDANKDDKYICPGCNNDIILRDGGNNRAHFSHLSHSTCGGESDIHISAKLHLKYILENKHLKILKNNGYSVIINLDKKAEVKMEYKFEYKREQTDVISIIDVVRYGWIGTERKMHGFEIYNTHKISEKDRPEELEWYEFDADEVNKRFEDSMNNIMVELKCIRGQKRTNGSVNSKDKKDKLGENIINISQRCAGNGKTFEIVRIPYSDDKFQDKEVFIYITKMHSAKNAIHEEFNNQRNKGLLEGVNVGEYDKNKRQYKIECKDINKNKNITIIIATVDSFLFSIKDPSISLENRDYFKSQIDSIVKGYMNEYVNYAGATDIFSKRCMIIIDESQNLHKCYMMAMESIISEYKVDLYIVGDIMQSAVTPENMLTYLLDIKKNIGNKYESDGKEFTIVQHIGVNRVRRFQNENFVPFINGIIPFKDYDLEPIESICDDEGKCGYKHENNIKPWTLFDVPIIYAGKYDESNLHKADKAIEVILSYMDEEINKYNYVPNNFMIIFPILKKNVLAEKLAESIQDFWVKKFNNNEYVKNVLMNNTYWKDKLEKINVNFFDYVYLHKSDIEGCIDLTISENSTRILTIHSSQGFGREVVFLLCPTDVALNKLTLYDKNKLSYNSLLNIAITRQKKSLYVGFDRDNEIYKRFIKAEGGREGPIKPQLSSIRNYNKSGEFFENIDNDTFGEIKSKIIDRYNLRSGIVDNMKEIVDLSHHHILYATYKYHIMVYIVESRETRWDQLLTIIADLRYNKPEILNCENYYKKLKDISRINKENLKREGSDKIKIREIPILKFEDRTGGKIVYSAHCEFIECTMNDIIEKVENSMKVNKIPELDPHESAVLFYMIETKKNGIYNTNTVMLKIYEITKPYVLKLCDGKLQEYFDERLIEHYKVLEEIKNKYNICVKKMNGLNLTDVVYNVDQVVSTGSNKNFILRNTFSLIGHTSDTVIYFVVKPQLNSLNFNNIICDEIINNYIIYNCNTGKYNNSKNIIKNIYTCIFTYDTEPIIYNFRINENNDLINNIIGNLLYKKYIQHNELLLYYYNNCTIDAPNDESDKSLTSILNSIEADDSIPHYIYEFYKKLSKKSEKYAGKETELINKCLKESIEDFKMSNKKK